MISWKGVRSSSQQLTAKAGAPSAPRVSVSQFSIKAVLYWVERGQNETNLFPPDSFF